MRLEALSRNNRRKGENCNAAVGDAARVDTGAAMLRAAINEEVVKARTSASRTPKGQKRMHLGEVGLYTVRNDKNVEESLFMAARNPNRIGSSPSLKFRDGARYKPLNYFAVRKNRADLFEALSAFLDHARHFA